MYITRIIKALSFPRGNDSRFRVARCHRYINHHTRLDPILLSPSLVRAIKSNVFIIFFSDDFHLFQPLPVALPPDI